MFLEHILTRVAHTTWSAWAMWSHACCAWVPAWSINEIRSGHCLPLIRVHCSSCVRWAKQPNSQRSSNVFVSVSESYSKILLLSPCEINKIMAELNPLSTVIWLLTKCPGDIMSWSWEIISYPSRAQLQNASHPYSTASWSTLFCVWLRGHLDA